VWDLAPHDLSIVDHLLGMPPRSISAWGCAHADPGIEDLAYVNVDYGDRLMASFHVNWLSPVKIRRLMVAGSEKSLIFDELNVAEPLRIYAKGIELTETADDIRRLRVGYRSGDVWAPHVEPGEPLQAAVTHFARCVRGEAEPLTDGRLGVRVVRLLEAATRSLRAQGGRVVLTDGRTGHAGDNGAVRAGHLRAGGPDRHPRAERGDPLLRQPVRVPGG